MSPSFRCARPLPWTCSAALLIVLIASDSDAADELSAPIQAEEAAPRQAEESRDRDSGKELPPVRRLEIPRRAELGPGPLDWVLERVDAGDDEWDTETIHERLSESLGTLAGWLTSADAISGVARESRAATGAAGASATPGSEGALSDADRTRALFAAEFRGDPLVEAIPGERLFADGSSFASVSRAADAASPALDGDAWLANAREMARSAGAIDKAKFKIFQVRRVAETESSSRVVRVRALLEFDGAAPGGEARQAWRSVWDLDWRLVGSAASLLRAERLQLERSRAPRPPYTEVTGEVLSCDAATREQLAFGVEHWRRRMDSATGIDVYGHQGIAVGDLDGDGRDDFYVPQPAGLPNRLFRQRADGRFEEIAAKAGVDVLDGTGGALWVDLDGDGDLDLLVATALEVLLFENQGDGQFGRRAGTGLETSHRRSASTLGLAAADFDLDGDLDLYVFSYIFWAGGGSKLQSTYPFPYHDANNGAPNFLFRNDGGLRFVDVTKESGVDENNERFTLAASWTDFDDDGDPDLYVANDFGRNNLYLNLGEGRFRDVAAERGVEDTGNGMSVTWEDVDNDGRLDLYVGNMWSSAGSRIAEQPRFEAAKLRGVYLRMARGNSFFRNLGEGNFVDESVESGASFGRWSWTCRFSDIDGDGREDLHIANGFITGERLDDL